MNLTVTKSTNQREVEMMVGKAMCAYGNYKEAINEHKSLVEQYGAISVEVTEAQYLSEYEATVRCIAMFVDESLPNVCKAVIAAAEEKFGI